MVEGSYACHSNFRDFMSLALIMFVIYAFGMQF